MPNPPLSTFCRIRPGLAFREAVLHVEGAPTRVAQAGDIRADGALDLERMARVGHQSTGASYRVSTADVLLQARGSSFRAAPVPDVDFEIIAAASLLILTPAQSVRPDYLAYFLNDPATQAELRRVASRGTINHLKASELAELQVHVPRLEDQLAIVETERAIRSIHRIEARLFELRRTELRALAQQRAEKNREC